MRDVLAALSDQLGKFRSVTIDGPPPCRPETETLSPRFLRQFRVCPMRLEDHTIDAGDGGPAGFRNHRGRAALHRIAM